MIKVIDYGIGNLLAFKNIYKSLNIPFGFVKANNDFEDATHLILPGVGSFDYSMNLLSRSGLLENLNLLLSRRL